MIPEYICAPDLALRWDCSPRTARRIIKAAPDRVKIGRRWYANYNELERPTPGNPNFTIGNPHQRKAARARWGK